VEVDVIISGPNEIVAIEVKNSARLREADVSSVASFLDDYPMAGGVLLYRGTERVVERGVLCMNVAEFLRALHPTRPVWDAAGLKQRTQGRKPR